MADLNNAVILMVITHPLIYKPSSPCTNTFVTIPSVPITMDITIPFHVPFFFFFSSLERSRYLSLCFSPFLTKWPSATAKSTIQQFLSLSLSLSFFGGVGRWLSISLVVWLRLDDLFVHQNQKELCESHFPGRIPGCAFTVSSYDQM